MNADPDPKRATAPLELPRQVMRRALAVALGGLVLTLLLGLSRAWLDTREELDAALALARLGPLLAQAAGQDDAALLSRLGEAGASIRHLRLELDDAEGRPRLRLPADEGSGPAWRPWRSLHGPVPRMSQSVTWTLDRPDGRPWVLRFGASPRDEEAEALRMLADLFLLMAACCSLMLLVMRGVIRRAFGPLSALLAAIRRLEQGDPRAMHGLPSMPAQELDAIVSALRHLADSLRQAEADRRTLAGQVHSLQEDERSRLAAELHDEFGQRLTALRVDAAWLARQLAEDAPRLTVVTGMSEQVALIQQDVRALLSRLRPLGPGAFGPAGLGEATPAGVTPQHLHELLQSLVDGWARDAGPRLRLEVARGPAVQAPAPPGSPATQAAERDGGPWLPRPLALALYRLSQEALTNVARHAGAGSARLELRLEPPADAASPRGWVHWRCVDDGIGADPAASPQAALRQGSGLAGMQERVWALDGEFGYESAAAREGSGSVGFAGRGAGPGAGASRGWTVWARLPFVWRSGAGGEADGGPGAWPSTAHPGAPGGPLASS